MGFFFFFFFFSVCIRGYWQQVATQKTLMVGDDDGRTTLHIIRNAHSFSVCN
ncbi:hypothetical protein CPAR01_04037 [Colletotrichum paranaense]|uniref:Uncharacterized protein n=2 Tax=Colletotrichum acutatum species complex TaxID=2707335 RepID=A0AAI9XYN2_9PEZI|nr:uncharacterized protein CPAR01_04037 [Colletotrichum paranaense]KAK1468971.1 hypothetical protein CMEL01_00738 [Colletotrichum melonis]KAK1543404.1 hypothetical protein CPAR01_04037 [Colletotrichum paranaense]